MNHPLFIRPGALHNAAQALSAVTELGLCVAPPSADTANKGTLRLRTSGVPTSKTAATARLLTGGNPVGYSPVISGVGAGCGVAWKNATDSASQYRGYIDSMYLIRTEFPVTYSTTTGSTSTPRELPDGALGFIVNNTGGTGKLFVRISTAGAVTSVVVGSDSSTSRPDFCVLPNGRLLAFVPSSIHGGAPVRLFSDDYGVTWTSAGVAGGLSTAVGLLDTFCVEYAEDAIVMVNADSAGGTAAGVYVSQDEGANFSLTDSSTVLVGARTCVTSTGKIIVVGGSGGATGVSIYPAAAGGGLGTRYLPGYPGYGPGDNSCVVTRDDGTIWLFIWNYGSATTLTMRAKVSVDGGETFADPGPTTTPQDIMNCFPGGTLAAGGYGEFSAGSWQGKIVLLGRTVAAPDHNAIHLLTFGGWENVTEYGANCVYSRTYLPLEYPENVGWTKADVGAGATITTQNPLRMVSTGANNSDYTCNASWWTTTPGDSRTIRFRVRVNSGGSLAGEYHRFRFVMNDGAVHEQEVQLRFSATQFQALDGPGNSLTTGAVTLDMTKYVDFLLYMMHDNPAGSGKSSLYYKQETSVIDVEGGLWVTAYENKTLVEQGGANDCIKMGGIAALAGSWDIALLEVANEDGGRSAGGFANPGGLSGRPLPGDVDYYLLKGVHLGGRNTAAIGGDTYSVTSTYNYGFQDVWQELRPSRCVRSSADNAAWDWRGNAGANDLFRGNTVALFGTNFRKCTFELNATDVWAGPAASVIIPLDATLVTATVGAAVRGQGYVGPASTLAWRPGQFRSDGDAHRFFVELDIGGGGGVNTYEITDNDEDRIYVKGVNLGAATGTFYIFGDRMAATLPFSQYRYCRVAVDTLHTADKVYHLGTVIFDKAFSPARTYSHEFGEEITPNVLAFESDAGYSGRVRIGPRKFKLAMSWTPLNAYVDGDAERRIRDFYSAIEGSLTPIVFWRNPPDISTLYLCYVDGVYGIQNQRGELDTALASINELTLTECI